MQKLRTTNDKVLTIANDCGYGSSVTGSGPSDKARTRVAAVKRVGDELARHFPRRPGETDRNELPDAISRG